MTSDPADPRSNDLLCLQAEKELARRSLSGSLGQILLIVIFWLGTEAYSTLGWRMAILGGSIIVLNLLRFHLSKSHERYCPTLRHRWNSLFNIAIGGAGLVWGTFFFIVLDTFGIPSHVTTIALLVGSGTSAAVTTSVGPRQNVARIFIACVLGIPLVQLLIQMDRQTLPMALIFVTYFGFLWYQLKLNYETYWTGLLSRKQLGEEYNRLQNVLDTIPGLVSWVGQDLTCRGVNRNFADHYGGSPSDFIGTTFCFRSQDETYLSAVQEFMDSEKDRAVREIQLTGKRGIRWHLLVMQKTNQNALDLSAMESYFISIDIDDLKTTEQALSEERLKTEMAAKLATLGEFTANIVHEIKNPLTAVMTSLELLRKQLQAPEIDSRTATALTDMAATACTRIDKIILGLRRFSRKTGEEPYVVADISNIVRDSVELTSLQFRAQKVRFELDPSTEANLYSSCNPVEISQVLVNLLQNALDAAAAQQDKWVRLKVASTDGTISILIIDSGKISAEANARIFEPFFTTKTAGSGTGLGLSISKRIIERHGGHLYVDPEAKNTTFVVELPRAEAGRAALRFPA